jgi:flavodoxin I
MRAVVIYDSVHGNTEMVAKAIASAMTVESNLVRVGSADPQALRDADLLVVGSPTHGGRPTPEIQKFLGSMPESIIRGTKVATFDTRFSSRLVKVFGYAADRAATTLESKGGVLVAPAEGFIVKGREGPLKEGELERASGWAKRLIG